MDSLSHTKCPTCSTPGDKILIESTGEHYSCTQCMALWGWMPMHDPRPPWAPSRYSYFHSGTEVRALMKYGESSHEQ